MNNHERSTTGGDALDDSAAGARLHFARPPDGQAALECLREAHVRAAAHVFSAKQNVVLANPHHEPQVDPKRYTTARSAAVLIGFCRRSDGGLDLLLTERQAGLRFAGHLAFPGGHTDADERSAITTALRETAEEVGIEAAQLEVLGALPPYYSHAGHRITGVLALVEQNARLDINHSEVARVLHVPCERAFSPRAYRIRRRSAIPYRANYMCTLDGEQLGGPTLSLLIHVYDALLRTPRSPEPHAFAPNRFAQHAAARTEQHP